MWSPARLSLRIVFLTIEPANKVEINILSARGMTSPGPWARASWVMMQWFRGGGGGRISRDVYLGHRTNRPPLANAKFIKIENLFCLTMKPRRTGCQLLGLVLDRLP